MSVAGPIHSRPQPRLGGHGLCLSAFTPADVPAILGGDRDPETARRLGWASQDSSAEKVRAHIAECERRWAKGDRVAWAVRLAGRPAALGHVELNIVDEGGAKMSYSTYPSARGRGLAARAVDLACVFAFERLGLARVLVLADADNVASRKVATKAGFTLEDVLREHGERGGRRHDMVLYARLYSDPRPSFRG